MRDAAALFQIDASSGRRAVSRTRSCEFFAAHRTRADEKNGAREDEERCATLIPRTNGSVTGLESDAHAARTCAIYYLAAKNLAFDARAAFKA